MDMHTGKRRAMEMMEEDNSPPRHSPKKQRSYLWQCQKASKTITKPATKIPKDLSKYNKHVIFKRAEVQLQDPDEFANKPKRFTLKDMNDIVNKALAERKEQLTEVYDNTLADLLYQQRESLSAHNQEFVSQRLRNSTFDYMS